ncbi:MAG TPA: GntR family transcriptional regulator [Candidatus Stackebrandtia excrementipullorum]|nr:GntR family transcriptional regulator [Candidatus Stackebrandtia excrementipullorum]
MIRFRIERRAGAPPYRQLIQQVKQAVRLGRLEPGDRLPTAREVVADTAINPNTVFKAYRALEAEGLVEARAGVGTFVRKTLGAVAVDTPLRSELADWLRRARAEGLTFEDVEALMKDTLDSQFGRETDT